MTTANARSLLSQVRREGMTVEAHGDRLRLDAPAEVLTPDVQEAVRSLKPHLLLVLEQERQVLDQPLSQFEGGRAAIELAVPWLDHTLWWVPTVHDADQLVHQGVARGRIWTAAELHNLASTVGLDREAIERIGRLKTALDCTVVGVLPGSAEPVSQAPAPAVTPRECLACHRHRFWRSVHGVVVCGNCHPPAAESLVADWIDTAEGPASA